MSLRGRTSEGVRPGTLAEIAATGRVRKITSCLPEGGGGSAFYDSPAAQRLDVLFAGNAAAPRGTGGRRAHRKAERLARAADRQTSAADLETSYATALGAMSALNAPESENI